MSAENVIKIREQVVELVNKHDPWYLLEIEAPQDEYSAQIDKIVPILIDGNPDVENVRQRLLEIFSTKEFELDEEVISALANDLFNLNS